MIAHLLIKPKHKHPMVSVDMLWATENGIEGQVASPPLRQALLLEEDTLADFTLQPGDLRENIIIRDFGLYHLPSGISAVIWAISSTAARSLWLIQ